MIVFGIGLPLGVWPGRSGGLVQCGLSAALSVVVMALGVSLEG